MILFLIMDLLEYHGVSKVEDDWFWESWSRPLGPKIMTMEAFRVSQFEIDKILVQNEAESLYGAFGLFFS